MSWQSEAWRIFRVMKRPVSSRDISNHTGMDERLARRYIAKLLAAKCIEFVHGSTRAGGLYYRALPDRVPPIDQRGRSEKAAAARAKGTLVAARNRRLRALASRPISQITAARLK